MKKDKLKIGYYIHHQGDGHRQRALAIASHYPEYFTLFGTNLKNKAENISAIDLPDDTGAEHIGSYATHYLPKNFENISLRNYYIAKWIIENKPDLFIVDVSVEIAMLVRLFSIGFIYFRLAGERTDLPHLEAFNNAETLIAPFPKILEMESTPSWVLAKTNYFANLLPNLKSQSKDKTIVVVLGAGGHDITYKNLEILAQSLPEWQINILGLTYKNNRNLKFLGWVENYQTYLECASLIIGSAGDGVLSNIISLNKPYICIPQSRPFDEQLAKAKKLATLGFPVVTNIKKADWRSLVRQAMQVDTSILQDNKTSQDAANLIINYAKEIYNGKHINN